MLMNIPTADKLHFLVSAAITGYIQQLHEVMPDIVNNLGKFFLNFAAYRFEIINSDIKNKADHRVAINFFSEPMLWHGTIENYLLISPVEGEKNKDGTLTHLVQLQPFFSIYSLKEEKE